MTSGPSNIPHHQYHNGGRNRPWSAGSVSYRFCQLLGRPLQALRRRIPAPLVLLLTVVQCGWILFDRHVTSQIRFVPRRPYIPPTESSPLVPYYSGPQYDEKYTGPTRAFPSRPFPCESLSSESRFPNPAILLKSGFLCLMQPQVASTTLSSVASRMSRNVAQRTRPQAMTVNRTACTTWTASIKAKRLKGRIRERSFLWTMVREPVDRLMSKFFHIAVSIEGKEPTLEQFQAYVEANAYMEYASYFKTMSFRRYVNPDRTDLFPSIVREILDQYDFVGVLERWDESLATLQVLLGLETQDMLYIKSRTSTAKGGASFHPLEKYDPISRKTTKECIPLRKPWDEVVTLDWKKYLHRPFMYDEVFEADVLLYRAINASLDATIESLGRDKVQEAVRKLQRAQQKVDGQCASQAVFPCSAAGNLQETTDCFVNDVGCGSQCLDSLGKSLATNAEL